jgi:hypothetical protein
VNCFVYILASSQHATCDKNQEFLTPVKASIEDFEILYSFGGERGKRANIGHRHPMKFYKWEQSKEELHSMPRNWRTAMPLTSGI